MKQLAGYFLESEEAITTNKFLVFNQENEQLSVVTLEELKELHKNGLITETVKNDKGSIYEIAYQKNFWKVVEENTTGSISLDDLCEFILPAISEDALEVAKEREVAVTSVLSCNDISYEEGFDDIRNLFLRMFLFDKNSITVFHGVAMGENVFYVLNGKVGLSQKEMNIGGISYFNHSAVSTTASGALVIEKKFMFVTSSYKSNTLEVPSGIDILDIDNCPLEELVLPESLHHFTLASCPIANKVVIPKNIGIGLNQLLLAILKGTSNGAIGDNYSEKDNTQAMVNLLKNEYGVTVEIKE